MSESICLFGGTADLFDQAIRMLTKNSYLDDGLTSSTAAHDPPVSGCAIVHTNCPFLDLHFLGWCGLARRIEIANLTFNQRGRGGVGLPSRRVLTSFLCVRDCEELRTGGCAQPSTDRPLACQPTHAL